MAEDLSKYANESLYKRPQRLPLNEVNLHGGKGIFTKTLFTEEKGEDNRYKTVDLGEEVKVVWLKIRRKLVQWDKELGLIRSTNEHNAPTDVVTMFGQGGPKVGIASEIREEFDDLRTVQVVYALLVGEGKSELVRLNVKGSSLGSNNKAEDTTSFYDYLKKFTKDEHFYEYVTDISTVKEKSNLGEYHAMNFSRGAKLTDQQMEKVATEMKKVHQAAVEEDEYYSKGASTTVTAKPTQLTGTQPGGERVIEYPEEEISPEDIPF